VVGILGYDFLSRFVTRVDYANELLSFYHPSEFEYAGEGVVVDAPLRSNAFCVPATVDGEYNGLWMVDLGASGVSFHYPYALANGLVGREGVEAVGFGAGGRMALRASRYRVMEVAGHEVNDPRISAPIDGLGPGTFSEEELIGNMGNTLFRHFVLYLDYERQQMVFERGDDFNREFPVDRSGLQIWLQDDEQVEVLFVAPGTPADDAGFAEGDVIRSVNGIDVRHFAGIVSLRELLKAAEGTEYTFGLLRGDAPVDIKLRLRELM
jgi:hypothetical protein